MIMPNHLEDQDDEGAEEPLFRQILDYCTWIKEAGASIHEQGSYIQNL